MAFSDKLINLTTKLKATNVGKLFSVDSSGEFTTIDSSIKYRNRITNGAMRIAQRNANVAVSATHGAYYVDMWKAAVVGGGTYNIWRANGSTVAPTGFTHSQAVQVITPDASIASTDNYGLLTYIEGNNFSDMAFGTASASSVTVSFYARSSVPGTYSISLRNGSGDRSYVANYTITSANTFEYKSITIPGCTTGTWGVGTDIGATLWFDLGSGSSFNQPTLGSWQSNNYVRNAAATNWISNSGATFYVTGVQLEAGSVATPFERLSIDEDLFRCQRYFEKSYNQDVVVGSNTASIAGQHVAPYPGSVLTTYTYACVKMVPKRVPPPNIFTYTSAGAAYQSNSDSGNSYGSNSAIPVATGENYFHVRNDTGSTINPTFATLYFHWTASAEF